MKRGEEITLEQMIEAMAAGSGVDELTLFHWNRVGPHVWRIDVILDGGDAEFSVSAETPTEALRLAYDAVEAFRNEVL